MTMSHLNFHQLMNYDKNEPKIFVTNFFCTKNIKKHKLYRKINPTSLLCIKNVDRIHTYTRYKLDVPNNKDIVISKYKSCYS